MSSTDKLDAQDRLILIQVKIERAKKHLRDLASEILTLTHTTIIHRDPQKGVPPHPITFMWNPDFKTVPTLSFDIVAISGDLVHNVRSALDHLAQQLVFVGSPHLTTSTISRQIGFPIAESMTKYEAMKAGKVDGMRPEAKEAIDRLKPYKAGTMLSGESTSLTTSISTVPCLPLPTIFFSLPIGSVAHI